MKSILGIGNAIVDVVCKVDDNFLEEHSLIKGSMSLIDENMAENLSKLKSETIASGGSIANTIAALAQLKNTTFFLGKVAHDGFGKKFITEIEKTGVRFISKNFSNQISAKSFILVTPDAQRTMCTFLGCASQISEDDVLEHDIKNASILYLEGYLWDQDSTILALKKAISLAKSHKLKIAFSLSDLFCVARHKKDFLELIANDLDIIFANENEIKELLDLQDLANEINLEKVKNYFSKNKKLIAVVTRSEKGCLVFNENNVIEVTTSKVENLVDTTGAGDAFAAGFLHGYSKGFTLEDSAKKGNLLAGKIIQKFGARFNENEIN